ncbi:hypothetical protein E2562_020905 [Oryza meyeriana var. granulata]|uniref:NB-ARC domain-containing protein n=1 Tax=Oryza meyeriana var. granulata TaxID=110450 RepID=A0A6G1D674_9ORYZ|nr:hypothetical protein E2562_020905 [Oryza meyeriana var. granulata]
MGRSDARTTVAPLHTEEMLDLAHDIEKPIVIAGGGQLSRSSSMTLAAVCRAARSLVGIGEPVEELLSLLYEVEREPEQMRVISVVGFGGLGKTTLAKAVYDTPRAKEKFHYRGMVKGFNKEARSG